MSMRRNCMNGHGVVQRPLTHTPLNRTVDSTKLHVQLGKEDAVLPPGPQRREEGRKRPTY